VSHPDTRTRRKQNRNKRQPAIAVVIGTSAAIVVSLLWDCEVASQPPPPVATLDQAGALLAQSQRSFEGVEDYTCTLVKHERVRGTLQPENVMTFAVRNRPFSVYLRWHSPKSVAGQEVCFVAGRNKGMMRVHPVGLAGVVGFVSVDPGDPCAHKDNRHPVTEAGLGNLLDSVARQWDLERRWNATEVRITDGEFNHRPCTWIETVHPNPRAGTFYGYRCILGLDKATHLPVASAAYDWPRAGGDPGGELLESYSYLDLRCNVGLGEQLFNH
jgi:hypothetical protein